MLRRSRTRSRAAQPRKASQLVKQAQGYANKASQAAQNAQELVATVASPPGQVGQIDTSVKQILAGYGSIVSHTRGLERHIGSAAVRRTVDKLLSQAKHQEQDAKARQGSAVVDALAKLGGANALGRIATARVNAAAARAIAARARGVYPP